MSKDAVQSRWKFLAGGVMISLIVHANNFVNLNEPHNPEVIGSFFGAATGGAILGWAVWWIWSKTRKSSK